MIALFFLLLFWVFFVSVLSLPLAPAPDLISFWSKLDLFMVVVGGMDLLGSE